MQEFKVTANEAGQRFDKLLSKYLNEAPKSFIYKMLRKKNIVLNGKKAKGDEHLIIGDCIKLFLSDDTIGKFSALKMEQTSVDLEIIYEDANILLINKPVGMLSQKAKESDESVVEHLISYLVRSKQITIEELRSFKPSICNRLDRNTSGLVLAGKSLEGLQSLGAMLKERSIEKYYLCLVWGELHTAQYLNGYLRKDEKTNKVKIYKEEVPDSQKIETEYLPIWSNHGVTLLEVHLITGKTHQIRSHLASIGCPIIGDYKYGNFKINQGYKQKYGLESQLLHAYRVVFPTCTGTMEVLSRREFVAQLPEKFDKICRTTKGDNTWQHGTQEG